MIDLTDPKRCYFQVLVLQLKDQHFVVDSRLRENRTLNGGNFSFNDVRNESDNEKIGVGENEREDQNVVFQVFVEQMYGVDGPDNQHTAVEQQRPAKDFFEQPFQLPAVSQLLC